MEWEPLPVGLAVRAQEQTPCGFATRQAERDMNAESAGRPRTDERKTEPLPVGLAVRARRINGEIIQARIIGPPIEHLRPIGEYYTLGMVPAGPEPSWRGTGRKSRERLRWEAERRTIGMYERCELLPAP